MWWWLLVVVLTVKNHKKENSNPNANISKNKENYEKKTYQLVIVTGNPRVIRGYPYPYPVKPVPAPKGKGFDGSG